MPATIMSMAEAIDALRHAHNTRPERPLIVCINSRYRDAGKSYFCAIAMDALHKRGVYDVHTSTSPVSDPQLHEHRSSLEYFFYDAGVNIPSPSLRSIWNHDIKPVFGRNIDIFAYIFNPRREEHTLEELIQLRNIYTIMIKNPHNGMKKF